MKTKDQIEELINGLTASLNSIKYTLDNTATDRKTKVSLSYDLRKIESRIFGLKWVLEE